jgi:hypothetical protein
MCIDDESEESGLDRRDFLIRGAGAVAGLVALGAEGAAAQNKEQPPTRVLDDPAIQHSKVTFKHGGKETFDGFLARPKADGTFPAVLVISGNVITEEYIPNTCAALALAGFVGLAPNLFHWIQDSGAKTEEERDKAVKETSRRNRSSKPTARGSSDSVGVDGWRCSSQHVPGRSMRLWLFTPA